MTPQLRTRLKAAGLHFSTTALVAAIAAAIVFLLWYPWPFSQVSGGVDLFLLVVGVDVVLGPLMTLVIFNTRKPRKELWRDMAVIVVLQVAGLTYGMHTVFIARPVVMALEGDRFRGVIAADVPEAELPKAPAALRSLSLTGPVTVNTRKPSEGNEQFDAIASALAGADIGMRPSFWQPWDAQAKAHALKVSKPVSELIARRPVQAESLRSAIAKAGKTEAQTKYIPLIARRSDWSVLIDGATGDTLGFVQVDGF